MRPILTLSFAAPDADGVLHGVLQSWPVALHGVDGADGAAMPLILVGPVAVAPSRQGEGLGRALVEHMLAAWDGTDPLVLIGDPGYYGRFFGFEARPTAEWTLPGPVERHRLLARAGGRTLPRQGRLGPRR